MLKNIFLGLLAISITFTTSISFAAESNMKNSIAVVDTEKVVIDSLAGKDLTKKLELEISAFQKKFSAKETKLQKERDSLQKKQSLLSSEAFEKKRKEFETKAIDFQREARTKRMAIEKAKIAAMEEIDVAAKDVTQVIAKERGYNIVVPVSSVIFRGNNIDITDEILKRLNKKITKVNFKIGKTDK